MYGQCHGRIKLRPYRLQFLQKQHEAKIIELRNQFVELLNGQEYDKQEIEKIEEKLKSIIVYHILV